MTVMSLGSDRVDGSRSNDGLEHGIQARKSISTSMKLLGYSMGPVWAHRQLSCYAITCHGRLIERYVYEAQGPV